jgi:hypothetical protein
MIKRIVWFPVSLAITIRKIGTINMKREKKIPSLNDLTIQTKKGVVIKGPVFIYIGALLHEIENLRKEVKKFKRESNHWYRKYEAFRLMRLNDKSL